MAYKKPTLTEILGVFLFKENSIKDGDLLDFASRIKALGYSNVEAGQEKVSNAEPIFSPLYMCWDLEKKRLVQVSKTRLVFNMVGDYPGWDAFVGFVKPVLEIFDALFKNGGVKEIGMECIDTISGKASEPIGRYLNCDGNLVPRHYKNSKLSSDINLGSGFVKKDDENFFINFRIRYDSEKMTIVVNGGHKKRIDGKVEPLTVLHSLHDKAREVFEDWITDHVRNEIMGGKK